MKKLILFILLISGSAFICLDAPKLSKRKIYEGVTLLMPEDFVVMSDNDIAQRYPSTKKPLAVFLSSDTKADFSFNNAKATFVRQDAKLLHSIYKATIVEMFDSTSAKKNDDPFGRDRVRKSYTFLNEGIRTVNKKEYAYFEFLSEYNNIKKYNYLMYAPHQNQIIVLNFSCDQRAMKTYQPIANAMMNSVKVSKKMTLPTYVPPGVKPGPRKKQTPQDILEMQNKNKSKIENK